MKKLWVSLSLLTLLACSEASSVTSNSAQRMYCGNVIEAGKEIPTSRSYPTYFLILKLDSSGTCIRVNVDVPEYYRLKKGGHVCVLLDIYQMYTFGNVSKQEHLSDTTKQTTHDTLTKIAWYGY